MNKNPILSSALSFLSMVCKPASEELGLWIGDKVRMWRLKNVISIIEKTQNKFTFENNKLQIHPKILGIVFDKGSWEDDSYIQEYWSSLLNSSFSENPSTENSLYFNILSQLSKTEVLLIDYFCRMSKIDFDNPFKIKVTEKGIIIAALDFYTIVGNNDANRLASEIEHLKGLQLLETGFGLASGFFEDNGNQKVGFKMSSLAMNLYYKGHGT